MRGVPADGSHRFPGEACRPSTGAAAPIQRVTVRAMPRLSFFFAYFWFSPVTGGWTNVRT
jgi:hypothetical protein